VDWMYGASWIIYTFAIFFILYSIQIFLQNRQREFEIWFIQGMSTTQFRIMIFYENVCIGIGSIIVGIICGLSIEKLFFLISTKIMDIPPLEYYFPGKAIIFTIGVYVLLFAILAYGTPFLMKKKKTLPIEQQDNQSKKITFFLSLLSIISLLFSYVLSCITSKTSLMANLVPILLLNGIGTYFFYTQVIPYLLTLTKKQITWYWKNTNLIGITHLLRSWKSHSLMFFIITMIYTTSFCMLGTLASSQALNKQFQFDYPLAVGYIAKNKETIHAQNISHIKKELKARGIQYTTYLSKIKFLSIQSTKIKDYRQTSIVSYTDYKNMVLKSSNKAVEPLLKDNEVMNLLTSQLDQSPLDETYEVKNSPITLHQKKISKYVTIPWRLLQSHALVVSDDMFARISSSSSATFIGFYSKASIDKTIGLGKTLVYEGRIMPSDLKPYSMIVSGTLYQNQFHLFRILFFIVFVIGFITFVASGSFVYFQLLSKIKEETDRYKILQKIGLTDREWNTTISWQLASLFFLPIAIAAIHSIFALIVLQKYFIVSIVSEWIMVVATFIVGQLLYYLLIRKRYIWKIKNDS
jgi:putative ABC transport system permease protein